MTICNIVRCFISIARLGVSRNLLTICNIVRCFISIARLGEAITAAIDTELAAQKKDALLLAALQRLKAELESEAFHKLSKSGRVDVHIPRLTKVAKELAALKASFPDSRKASAIQEVDVLVSESQLDLVKKAIKSFNGHSSKFQVRNPTDQNRCF